MFRTIALTALIAGVIAGLVVTGFQTVKVLPLIHQAEIYETAGHGQDQADEEQVWAPADGIERLAFTVLSNVLAGVGFALLLTAGFALRGGRDWREGFLWGLAGFAAFALAPALGLPPEVPGMQAADLVLRQSWWIGTAIATLAGLGLLVYGPRRSLKALGILVLVAPHVIGAPHSAAHDGGAPPAEIAAAFVSASLVANLLFWLVIGGVSAFAYRRLSPADAEANVAA